MDNNFRQELAELINRYNKENGSDTPDWILANFIESSLLAYDEATRSRDLWFNFQPWANLRGIEWILENKSDS